jgi:transcriptional regulator NrdR family protein
MNVNNVNETHAGNLNDFIIRNLPSVARSDGKTENFEPNRIIKSLLEETTIPEDDAREVTEEIVIQFLNSEHELVTAPFIREQICSILFKRNPRWRFEYTRLGLPFRDFENLCSGFFDSFKNGEELNEKAVEQVITTLDRKMLAELVRRMAKDYIGVRNKIHDSDNPEF